MTPTFPTFRHPVDELLDALVGQPGSRHRLPTPVLLADLDRLEANIARMASRAAGAGLAVRPHAKSHKCAAIARRQLEAGAAGICCAKIGEAEALAAAGVGPILLTSPIVGDDQARRVAALARAHPGLAVVVDHPRQARELARAFAGAEDAPLATLVDVDVGLARTGVSTPEDALAVATAIAESGSLRLAGVQGYGGHWQHIAGLAKRRAAIAAGMERLSGVVSALRAAGHAIDWVTGGGTGSFSADAQLGVLTEVQPGSYIFMDSQYRDALEGDADGEYEQSLFVQARVVSVNAPSHVTVDAGLKAFATDGPLPRAATPRYAACRYFWYGDEHGGLSRPEDGAPIALGERIEFVPPHCDPTIDRYDRIVLVRGDTVVEVAPIEAGRRSQ
jgi:D-serine deaminase-like pyridoxal phosphate-dependent protein